MNRFNKTRPWTKEVKNYLLSKEVKREVADGVAQDGLLDQQHIAPALDDRLEQLLQ